MRLSYVPTEALDAPAFVFRRSTPSAARAMSNLLTGLLADPGRLIHFDPDLGLRTDPHIHLSAASGGPFGVSEVQPGRFVWEQPGSDWETTIALLGPFCFDGPKSHVTFQYLETAGDIRVIWSTGDTW